MMMATVTEERAQSQLRRAFPIPTDVFINDDRSGHHAYRQPRFDAILARLFTSFSGGKNDKGRRWNTDLYGERRLKTGGRQKKIHQRLSNRSRFPIQKPKETASFFSTCKVRTERESSELSACR